MKRSILIVLVIVAAGIGGIVGSLVTMKFFGFAGEPYASIENRQQSVLANYSNDTSYNVPQGLNFLNAAKKVTSGVVHIRTSYGPGDFSANPLENLDFQPRSSGSGVIISEDGFIVTNNHVVEDASNIEIVMNNNQRYFAKVIGTDPTTDLA